jgi:SsrA-binding protein
MFDRGQGEPLRLAVQPASMDREPERLAGKRAGREPVVAEKHEPNFKVVADNRRARYNFEVGEIFEAGLVLTGTEVKSLRTGKATIAESYAHVDRKGEAWLVNANIPEYNAGNRFNHEPKRPRKLLLKHRELAKLSQAVEREGLTIVPLKLYFNPKGRAKLQIALARGKKLHDKREVEKKRDWSREKGRLMREKG